jgi:hypothetical protein
MRWVWRKLPGPEVSRVSKPWRSAVEIGRDGHGESPSPAARQDRGKAVGQIDRISCLVGQTCQTTDVDASFSREGSRLPDGGVWDFSSRMTVTARLPGLSSSGALRLMSFRRTEPAPSDRLGNALTALARRTREFQQLASNLAPPRFLDCGNDLYIFHDTRKTRLATRENAPFRQTRARVVSIHVRPNRLTARPGAVLFQPELSWGTQPPDNPALPPCLFN